jgi:Domain of unknown function DUF29
LLEENPSLKSKLDELFLTAYPRARTGALDETGLLDLPAVSPFTIGEVPGDLLPEG